MKNRIFPLEKPFITSEHTRPSDPSRVAGAPDVTKDLSLKACAPATAGKRRPACWAAWPPHRAQRLCGKASAQRGASAGLQDSETTRSPEGPTGRTTRRWLPNAPLPRWGRLRRQSGGGVGYGVGSGWPSPGAINLIHACASGPNRGAPPTTPPRVKARGSVAGGVERRQPPRPPTPLHQTFHAEAPNLSETTCPRPKEPGTCRQHCVRAHTWETNNSGSTSPMAGQSSMPGALGRSTRPPPPR